MLKAGLYVWTVNSGSTRCNCCSQPQLIILRKDRTLKHGHVTFFAMDVDGQNILLKESDFIPFERFCSNTPRTCCYCAIDCKSSATGSKIA